MHSRIVQLSEEPILKDEYITEDLFDDTNGLDGIADYFSEDTDREADIDWLLGYLKEMGLDIKRSVEEVPLDCHLGAYCKVDKITFSYKSLAHYMENKVNAIQEALDKVFDLDLNKSDDASKLDFAMYGVKSSVEAKFGFYIWDTDGWCTVDSFLLSLFNNWRRKDTYTFYIGGTLDYHC